MIQGIGAGFIPEVLNREVLDEVIAVDDQEAYQMARRLTKEEGIFAGLSEYQSVKSETLPQPPRLPKAKPVVPKQPPHI